jgi:NAD(P)-dependent dehydrogenase (short-subunit alcohol dehydrogenase family)
MLPASRASTISSIPQPRLDGKVCWIIGGVGIIGTGVARGLLRAGATVIVNSRHMTRLDALSEELGHPENLVCMQASMIGDAAPETVSQAMSLSAGRLDHVVSHSAVRWWSKDADETQTIGDKRGLLSLEPEEYAMRAMQLPLLQFQAARLLIPRLSEVPGASYTFLTGGAGERSRSGIGQVNAQGVWGLAAALRTEERERGASGLKLGEVRLGLRFNRNHIERQADPRGLDGPLSHELGRITAGIALSEPHKVGLHCVESNDDVRKLRTMYPAPDDGYRVHFRASDVL